MDALIIFVSILSGGFLGMITGVAIARNKEPEEYHIFCRFLPQESSPDVFSDESDDK